MVDVFGPSSDFQTLLENEEPCGHKRPREGEPTRAMKSGEEFFEKLNLLNRTIKVSNNVEVPASIRYGTVSRTKNKLLESLRVETRNYPQAIARRKDISKALRATMRNESSAWKQSLLERNEKEINRMKEKLEAFQRVLDRDDE